MLGSNEAGFDSWKEVSAYKSKNLTCSESSQSSTFSANLYKSHPQKEEINMAELAIAVPILPGKTEAWKQFNRELEARRSEHEEVWQRLWVAPDMLPGSNRHLKGIRSLFTMKQKT
jgi:hypothetical protein